MANRSKRCRAILRSAVALALATPVPAIAQQQNFQFNIPAQSLDSALRAFAQSSRQQILFDRALVAGKRSEALVGNFAIDEGLARLLGGSGLRATRGSRGAYVIQRVSGEFAAGEDANGQNSEIVVTGTNLRGVQPTSPVITISRREIDESGATSVDGVMRQLPQNFGGGVGSANFFVNQPGVLRIEVGEGLNLRGLGQRATLTLVNGRRLAPGNGGGFVDISLIPITAVERIEVLTDGASAIYGSDAVGGVVNFILRDDFRGLETVALAGTATNGGGDQAQVGLTGGHAWTGGHALISYEFRHEDEILARDRDFSINLNPTAFFLPDDRRHSLLGLVEQDLTDRLSLELNGAYATRRTERAVYITGAPPSNLEQEANQLNLGAQLEYELGGGWSARAEALYSRSHTDSLETQSAANQLVEGRVIRTETHGIGLKIDGNLFELPGGSMKAAIGAEARWEDFVDDYRNTANTRSLASSRSVRSIHAELLTPLFSRTNRRPGFERLQLSAGQHLGPAQQMGELSFCEQPMVFEKPGFVLCSTFCGRRAI